MRRRRSLLILTPLVDVVFILLIFFMLASSYSDRQVISMLTPAAAEKATVTGSANAVLIRIGRDGRLNLSGEPMGPTQLAQEVAMRSLGEKEFVYLVQPDREVNLQQVVVVLDLLQSSGARNVSLTRKPRS